MKIREKVTVREDGTTEYNYFARKGRVWVNLRPYGNRIPPEWERRK